MSDEERKSFIASGELVSLAEAAKDSPYSAEYLSLRARTGHLKAMKIARNWLTTREAVLLYIKEYNPELTGVGSHGRTNQRRSA